MPATIKDVKERFDLWFYELDPICQVQNPWGFLCISALIDYLSRLANGKNTGRSGYIQFIKDYFPSKYQDFQYNNGKKDLPEQMYHVLRNGLVHSFSLIPEKNPKMIGRDRSIVLIHAEAARRQGLSHLDKYPGRYGTLDAALLICEFLLMDTKVAAQKLLLTATPGSTIENNILSWFTQYPPIRGED